MNVNSFVKHHGPLIAQDLPRLNALNCICEQLDGVTTARVLYVDERRHTVAYEHLDLKDPMNSKADDPEVMSNVGRLLAKMHTTNFPVPNDLSNEPYPLESLGIGYRDAKILADALPPGWFHSDFWHGNVFTPNDSSIVVIDPLPAEFMFSRKFVIASGALDVAMMYMSLLLRHPYLKQCFLSTPTQITAAEFFLRSYLEQRDACSTRVIESLRRVILCLADIWVSALPTRLTWPIYAAKQARASQLIRALERSEQWTKK